MKFSFLFIAFLLACSISFAQSAENNSSKKNSNVDIDRGATYGTQKTKAKKKKSKYTISGEYDKKIEEYEKRMVANSKRYAKMEKEMKKPQYSDPTYFGHKKKPKKRPPGKKKLCKECMLVH